MRPVDLVCVQTGIRVGTGAFTCKKSRNIDVGTYLDIDIHTDVCTDTCKDLRMDMCTDVCMHMYTDLTVHRHVSRHVYRHVAQMCETCVSTYAYAEHSSSTAAWHLRAQMPLWTHTYSATFSGTISAKNLKRIASELGRHDLTDQQLQVPKHTPPSPQAR